MLHKHVIWTQRGKLTPEWVHICFDCLERIKARPARKTRYTGQLNLFAEERKR